MTIKLKKHDKKNEKHDTKIEKHTYFLMRKHKKQ